jgi:hypothetical protein
MARRRSYKSKTSFNVFVLDKYTIGRGFIVMGALYFFALFMAPSSPILQRFHQASYFVFGKVGTPPFFALSIVF